MRVRSEPYLLELSIRVNTSVAALAEALGHAQVQGGDEIIQSLVSAAAAAAHRGGYWHGIAMALTDRLNRIEEALSRHELVSDVMLDLEYGPPAKAEEQGR